jgi:hypothetical protein
VQLRPAGRRYEVCLLLRRKLERLGQQVQRTWLWTAIHPALQIGNGARTQSRALGKRFLGQPGQDAVLPEQCSKGAWWWGGPLRAEAARTVHQPNLPSTGCVLGWQDTRGVSVLQEGGMQIL